MTIQTIPPGWSADQLDALNRLDDYAATLQVVNQVIQATNDTSAEATRVRSELIAATRATWQRVKTFPPA